MGYKAIAFMTRKGPTSVEWLTPDLTKELGVAWAKLQPPRAIPIPSQLKLRQPTSACPDYCGVEVRAAAVADSDGPRITEADAGDAARDHLTGAARDPLTGAAAAAGLADTPNAAACGKSRGAAHCRTSQDHRPDRAWKSAGPDHTGARAGRAAAVTAAQKVVLYEEDPADPNGKRFVGSVIWRTAMVTAVPGQPPQLVIRADIEVPERKLAMTFSFRRNTDKGLPATHTVEIIFKLPADFPAGGISNVPGILMKQAE